ncbi:uncharacterized protein BDV17DRAFT_286457 [Aspergillus undulatus]|uniref:uncharacterized protein n=1 Tax=Aspergillus undulatus TaxID=1810928 RepID=UPI003CCDE7DF
MSTENEDTPDLNSILRTLSAFSNQTSSQTHEPQHQVLSSHNAHNNDLGSQYEQPDAHSLTVPQSQSQAQLQAQPPPQQPTKPHPHPHSQTKDIKETASTITTWPAALKQVMRTVSQNEEIQRRIRYLIQRQHDHERQWWKGREALLQKQSTRKEKKRELDEVLRKVGAPVDEKEVSTAAEDATELSSYDTKVHRASRQMADAMLVELKALDVPFFCLSKSLVISGEAPAGKKMPSEASGDDHAGTPTTADKQGKLSMDELLALQRRMLELLQDLCRE